jgi:hypothetical protein
MSNLARCGDLSPIFGLEPNLWTEYLAPLGGVDAESMIIYQWKRVATPAEPEGVEDLIALCSFRIPRENVPLYILAIVALGALGSGTQALGVTLLSLPGSAKQLGPQLLFLALLGFGLWLLFHHLGKSRAK